MSEEERVAERAKNALGIYAFYFLLSTSTASEANHVLFTRDYFTETSFLYDIIILSP